MISENTWKELWGARWESEESPSSDTFHQRLKDLTEEFCDIIREINLDLPVKERYAVEIVSQGLEILGSTTEMYGTGVLPMGFFLSLQTPGMSQGVDVFRMIEERNEKYFSTALGSFFPQEVREKFVKPYLDLFTAKDRSGKHLVGDEDRIDLWRWIHSLIRKMAEYVSAQHPSLAHITDPLLEMGLEED